MDGCGTKSSLLKEKLGVVRSLPILCCFTTAGAYGKIVSQPLLPTWCGFFFSFSQRVRVSQLVSGFLSEWISLSVAVGFVSVKGVSSGASYVTMFTAASEMPKFIPFHPTIHHTSANSCPHSKKGGGSDHCSRRVGGNKPLGQVRGSKRGSWPQSWIIKFNKILKAF